MVDLIKEGNVDFDGWTFGYFGELGPIINKAVAETLEKELSIGKVLISSYGIEEGKLEISFGFEVFDDLWFKFSIMDAIEDIRYWDPEERQIAAELMQSMADKVRNMK
jgi:hypothetical protein